MLVDDFSVQRFLAGIGRYNGPVDGAYGPASKRAARSYLGGLSVAKTSYSPEWADDRVRRAVEQAIFESIGQDLGGLDGVFGPRTQIALERWQDHITFERVTHDADVAHQPVIFPRQKDAEAFYGAPGTNCTTIIPPYPVYFAGRPVRAITLNKKCAESGLAILTDVHAHYGDQIHALGLDDFGGSLNVRPMRNGRTMSMHGYGCAWDWSAARNGLRATAATAQFAGPDYKTWIDIHYAHGWISLGRERNFDFMHFQAARL